MAWVTITGAGVTSATRYKGDALNKINDMLNAVDVLDTVKINSAVTWSFVSNAFRIKNPADTFSYIFTPSAILADRILTIPLLITDEEIVTTQATQAIIKNKDFEDSTELVGTVDATKKADFLLSGATTGKKTTVAFIHTLDRTITIPNATDTLVGKATTDIFTNKSLDANGTGNVITNIGDAEIELHTSTKITITNKSQLNTEIVYNDQENTYLDFAQLFKDNQLQINNPADTFKYIITAGAIAADRILNIPVTTATDTLAVLGLAQTFTAGPTFSTASVTITGGLTVSTVAALFKSSMLTLQNPADTFAYTIVPAAIAAARSLNLPLITGTDTLAVLGLAETFTAVQTMTGLNVILMANTGLTIRNPANTFAYTLAGGAIVAARTITLPVTTGADTMAVLGFQQTYTAGPIFATVAARFNDLMLTIQNPAATFNYTVKAGAITAARQLTLPLLTQTETMAVVPTTSNSSPADPTGTTSLTGVMMGLAGAFTPVLTGKVLIIINGDMGNDTLLDGSQIQIRTGTGAAPTNGAALTGTTRGTLVKSTSGVATERDAFCIHALFSGLTVATAIWIDIGLAAITAGTATIKDVHISCIEM